MRPDSTRHRRDHFGPTTGGASIDLTSQFFNGYQLHSPLKPPSPPAPRACWTALGGLGAREWTTLELFYVELQQGFQISKGVLGRE